MNIDLDFKPKKLSERDFLSKAYYALFQAARAVLATLGFDSRKHSGVISLFNVNFIKTGVYFHFESQSKYCSGFIYQLG